MTPNLLCLLHFVLVGIQVANAQVTITPFPNCAPPLPQIFATEPPSGSSPEILNVSQSLDAFLKAIVNANGSGIDSLAFSVVTAGGSVFEGFYGVLKANETDGSKRGGTPDRNSIYRIASVSKMITTMETFILRDKGELSWDDPITKFIPNFTYTPYPGEEVEPIILRRLGTHMAGFARDYPPNTIADWPHSLVGTGTPGYGSPFPTLDGVLTDLQKYLLVMEPFTFPSYDNIGFGLLGVCNAIAGSAVDHAAVIKRDIFDPVGMDSSSFLATPQNRDRIAVSSAFPQETDFDFGDISNPSGGQFSSTADLIKLAQTMLNPKLSNSVLPARTTREWFRPVQVFNGNGFLDNSNSQTGMPWEITNIQDSWGREHRIYEKSGDLIAYHASFDVIPTAGYTVIVMLTGQAGDAHELARQAITRFQPAFDTMLADITAARYSGSWSDNLAVNGSEMTITPDNGSLFVDHFVLEGVDVLNAVGEVFGGVLERVGLWSTGRLDDFRLSLLPPQPAADAVGCLTNWGIIDIGYKGFEAINRVVFNGSSLVVPSTGTVLTRRS